VSISEDVNSVGDEARLKAPFYGVDQARNLDQDGAGLTMSMVDNLARAGAENEQFITVHRHKPPMVKTLKMANRTGPQDSFSAGRKFCAAKLSQSQICGRKKTCGLINMFQ